MITGVNIEQLTEPARGFYSSALPYHNFNHAKEVDAQAWLLAEQLENVGVEVNRDVVQVAAFWHDAGYIENHLQLGFQTKEQYSAHLADEFLKTHGTNDIFRRAVHNTILATTDGVSRQTVEELLIHRSDIANIGGLYEEFREHTINLWNENDVLGKPHIPWDKWKHRVAALISKTIAESRYEIPKLLEKRRLPAPVHGPLSVGDISSFDTTAERNRTLLLKEPEPPEGYYQ